MRYAPFFLNILMNINMALRAHFPFNGKILMFH